MFCREVLLQPQLLSKGKEQPAASTSCALGKEASDSMNCHLCQCPYYSIEHIFDHLRVHHSTPTIFKYTCTACVPSASFQNFHRFKRHVNSKHSDLFPPIAADRPNKPTALGNISSHPLEPDRNLEIAEHPEVPNANEDTTRYEREQERRISEIDILDIRNSLREKFLNFTLSLHNKSNYTRKDVVSLQHCITDEIVKPICDALLKVAPNLNSIAGVNDLINDIYQPFEFISTEQKLNTTLQSINLNDALQEICFEDDQKNIVSKGCLMPIKQQFKKFFESGNVYSETINNMRVLEESKEIVNVVNGTLWNEIKKECEGRTVIPYFLYSDEVEMNDAIGAHSGTHKVTGLYYNFPTIPSYFLSRLENIFVAGFIKASDLARLGPSKALKELIDLLIELEQTGLSLEVDDDEVRVYFVLMGILGDNLGINTLMGFATSFSSLLYCRFCTQNKYKSQTSVTLDVSLNRTKQNYEIDCLKDFKESGIKELSAFNNMKHYHVAEFAIVDIMHDFYSHGICSYDLSLVLSYMIQTLHISLQTINYRIQMFDVKETERRNTFKTITREHIKSANFKMTAREMMLFVHYFPLMFGDLIPENNKVWNFVLSLVELTTLVLLPKFNDELLKTLEEHIEYHHFNYRHLFAESLKPKYHILLHYVQTIKKVGPPRYTWSFRFEAFHQIFKKYCRNITSRRNICLTLCTKAKLIFMHDIKHLNHFKNPVMYKNAISLRSIDLPYFSKLELTNELLTLNFKAACTVTYKGTEYKVGQFLTKSNLNMQSVELYEIKDILISSNQIVNIACQQWAVEGYDEHFAAFRVSTVQSVYRVISIDLFDGPPIHVYDIQGSSYVRLKKYFV